MTCYTNCIYCEVCDIADDMEYEDAEIMKSDCPHFKNKADFAEVVRCKDCQHRHVPMRCALWYGTLGDKEYFVEKGDEFYCSFGERKVE